MEEKVRVKRPHRLNMEDRKRIDFTGITDVVYLNLIMGILQSKGKDCMLTGFLSRRVN